MNINEMTMEERMEALRADPDRYYTAEQREAVRRALRQHYGVFGTVLFTVGDWAWAKVKHRR